MMNRRKLAFISLGLCLFLVCIIRSGVYSNKFDVFSNNLMISDMICRENFGKAEFIRTYGDLNETLYIEQFVNNIKPDIETVWTYTSQVGMHRYIYYILDSVLPFSNNTKLMIMCLMNAVFLALMLTIIIMYISRYMGKIPGVFTAIICVFAVNLTRYGTNLYWMGGVIFLPMVLAFFCSSNIKETKMRMIFGAALIGNIIKNLCYYEFASAIMVATVVPFLFVAIKENLSYRRIGKIFFAASIGALSGFALSLIWKFILLCRYNQSIKTAIDAFLLPIKMRVSGTANVNSFSETVMNSKSAGTLETIKIYLDMHDFGIGKFTLSNGIVIAIILMCILCASIMLLGRYRNDRTLLSLVVCTILSFVGPLSWMILAKPHAYIHRSICAILWYIPLAFFGIPLCGYILDKLYLLIKKKY